VSSVNVPSLWMETGDSGM